MEGVTAQHKPTGYYTDSVFGNPEIYKERKTVLWKAHVMPPWMPQQMDSNLMLMNSLCNVMKDPHALWLILSNILDVRLEDMRHTCVSVSMR